MGRGVRLNTEKVKEALLKVHGNDYVLLNEYGDNGNKLHIKHLKCGNEYETIYGSIITRSRRCKYCFSGVRRTNLLSYEDARSRVESVDGYTMLTTESEFSGSQSTIKIFHDECNNILEMKYNNFVTNKARCKICYHKSRSNILDNYNFQRLLDDKYDIDEYVIQQDPDVENNKTTKVPVLHSVCGTIWNIDRFHIIDETNRCPKCFRISRIHSKYSMMIEKYLIDNNIDYIMEYPLLGNIATRKDLISDYYLPEYNLIIEYDGKQHFKPMYNDEVKFNKQVARDNLKNKFLSESNYNWIRIDYRVTKEEDIQKVIENKIKTISSYSVE